MQKSMWVIIFIFCMTFTACAEEESPVLATVNGKIITQADFDLMIENIPPEKRMDPQIRITLLDNMIKNELFVQKAQEANLDKDADIIKKAELYKHKLMVQKYVEMDIKKAANIDDAKMQAYYEANLQKFTQPEQVHAAHILVKDEATAKTVMEKIKSGEAFDALAKTYSTDSSAQQGGDLGFFSKGRMVKPFEDSAFVLKPGEISEIVKSEFGFHIIKVIEKKEQSAEPFEKVKPTIENYLMREFAKTYIEGRIKELQEAAKIEILKK